MGASMRNKQIAEESIHVLVACEDIALGKTLERFLDHTAITIDRCHDLAGLLRHVSRHAITILVLDLALGKDSNINLVSFVKERNPSTRMILLFEMDHIEEAIEGIRQGAFFYLPRSSAPSDIALAVGKALENRQAELHLDNYEQSVFEELVGHTDAMRRIIDLIRKVAPTNSTVLLLGESGTGKEVVAQTLHRLSARRDKPFVALNCAALPHALLESELFGHVRGAFTGADADKIGLFEAADGGTLFLDEIGDMELITQAKLLRVLQNGEIRAVGDTISRKVNVRIIAATNRDLMQAVESMAFREDLYYRLNVIQIRIPPLRERMDALPALVNHFLARFNQEYKKTVRGVDPVAARYLQEYAYPGNVRELESIIAHAVIMTEGEFIGSVDLPEYMRRGITTRPALVYQREEAILSLREVEEQHIRRTLEALKGNQSQAAKRLGISRSTLWRKMNEYQIEPSSEDVDDK